MSMGKIPSIQQYDLASLVVPMSPVVGENMLYLLRKSRYSINRPFHRCRRGLHYSEKSFRYWGRDFCYWGKRFLQLEASFNLERLSSFRSIIVKVAFILEILEEPSSDGYKEVLQLTPMFLWKVLVQIIEYCLISGIRIPQENSQQNSHKKTGRTIFGSNRRVVPNQYPPHNETSLWFDELCHFSFGCALQQFVKFNLEWD